MTKNKRTKIKLFLVLQKFQIQTQKLEIKAQSKVGSLDNVKHKPGGGEKKIFDDKDYLKNVEHGVPLTTPPAQVKFSPHHNSNYHLVL